jgi:predicted ATPase
MQWRSSRTQLVVTTHSDKLARLVQKATGAKCIRLEKIDGETRVTTKSEAEVAEQDA